MHFPYSKAVLRRGLVASTILAFMMVPAPSNAQTNEEVASGADDIAAKLSFDIMERVAEADPNADTDDAKKKISEYRELRAAAKTEKEVLLVSREPFEASAKPSRFCLSGSFNLDHNGKYSQPLTGEALQSLIDALVQYAKDTCPSSRIPSDITPHHKTTSSAATAEGRSSSWSAKEYMDYKFPEHILRGYETDVFRDISTVETGAPTILVRVAPRYCSPVVLDASSLPIPTYDINYVSKSDPEYEDFIRYRQRRLNGLPTNSAQTDASNAMLGVAEVRNHVRKLAAAYKASAETYWDEFDRTGRVSTATSNEYAYWIARKFTYNSETDMLVGIARDFGGSAHALVTSSITQSGFLVPEHLGAKHDLGMNGNIPELMKDTSSFDYISTSKCHIGWSEKREHRLAYIYAQRGGGSFQIMKIVEMLDALELDRLSEKQFISLLLEAGQGGRMPDAAKIERILNEDN